MLADSPLSRGAETVRDVVQPFDDKSSLGTLRIVLSLIWFIGLFLIVRPHEKIINRGTGGILSLFGKNSLYVYGWHGFILFIIGAYFRPLGGSMNIWFSTLVALLVLTLLYAITRYRFIFTKSRQLVASVFTGDDVS